MQQGRGGGGKPPLGIAFDSDFGNNIDSVLTMALLQGLATKNESRIISVTISKSNIQAAQLWEVVTRFYASAPAPEGNDSPIGNGPRVMPVGLATNGRMATQSALATKVLATTRPDGKPAYPHTINRVVDTSECGVLTRNMLLAQNDDNGAIVVSGPLTNMLELMNLYGARPQLAAKVKVLAVAAGSFPGGAADPNIKADIAAAKKVFAEWPGPIMAVGTEVGEALPYPAASIEKDFAWATAPHPVVDSYKAFKAMPYDAPSSGIAAALYTAHSADNLFKVSEPGTISVLDDGRTKFTPAADGKHRYLIVDPAQKEKVVQMYVERISAKPAPPVQGFGRRGQAAAVPPPADKPADNKAPAAPAPAK